MTPEEMRKKAEELFAQRFHWSQAILAVGQEKLGVGNPAIIKAVAALGGGIASSGRVCGILTGGVVFLSSLYGKETPDGLDDPRMWRLTYKLTKKFEELTRDYGGMDCRDIARVDWKDRDSVKAFYSQADGRRGLCRKLVGDTAYALGEILEKAEQP